MLTPPACKPQSSFISPAPEVHFDGYLVLMPNPQQGLERRGRLPIPTQSPSGRAVHTRVKASQDFLSYLLPSPAKGWLCSKKLQRAPVHISCTAASCCSPTHLIFAGVLHYFCAQVAAFDGPQVLLIAFPVARVFVQHVRRASLRLRLDDGVPELLGLHHSADTALLLIAAKGTRCSVTPRLSRSSTGINSVIL